MAPGRVTAMRGFVSQAVARSTKMPGSTVNPALRCCADDWAMAAGLPLGRQTAAGREQFSVDRQVSGVAMTFSVRGPLFTATKKHKSQ